MYQFHKIIKSRKRTKKDRVRKSEEMSDENTELFNNSTNDIENTAEIEVINNSDPGQNSDQNTISEDEISEVLIDEDTDNVDIESPHLPVTEVGSTKSPGNTPIVVSRIEIPAGKITKCHVRRLFPPSRQDLSDGMILHKMELLEQRKKHALDNFRSSIKKMMIEEAVSIGLKRNALSKKNVHSFQELMKSVENNRSKEYFRKLWEVAIGQFDRSPYWYERMAQTYMTEENLKYNSQEQIPGLRTSCFEALAKWARGELVRRLQIRGKKSHGRYLSISVFKGKRQRRRPGVFYPEFIQETDKWEGTDEDRSDEVSFFRNYIYCNHTHNSPFFLNNT